MSVSKKKVIHVENLIIHAKDVKVVNEVESKKDYVVESDQPTARDPWGFFWGRPQTANPIVENSTVDND